MLERTVSPKIRTYDSSAAPAEGEDRAGVARAKVDLGALRDRFAAIEEEAKANDPTALKARVKGLEKEIAALKRLAPVPDAAALDAARSEATALAFMTMRREADAGIKAAESKIFDAVRAAMADIAFGVDVTSAPTALKPARAKPNGGNVGSLPCTDGRPDPAYAWLPAARRRRRPLLV